VTDHDDTRETPDPTHDTEATTMYATPDTDVVAAGATERPARRRGPDPLALIVGLATLAMAVFAFVGELPDLSGFDPRWLLAGGAAVVGLVLLVGSLRGRSGGRPDRS
jgi:peptidoglycan/LPS O-acetylase OafA/YrhL